MKDGLPVGGNDTKAKYRRRSRPACLDHHFDRLGGNLSRFSFGKMDGEADDAPLERVISVINSVSHGDYSARVGLHTRDEFGELGSQLDEMIDNTVRLMELIRYQSEQKRSYELENLQMQITSLQEMFLTF